MAKAKRHRVFGVLAVVGALALAGAPAYAGGPQAPKPAALTCSGGEIGSGTYASINVTGPCSVANGAVIKVVGNINVRPGAMLDAQSVPSTISVGRNVTGATGSLVGLGCQPTSLTGNSAHPCLEPFEEEHSTIAVGGNISLTDVSVVALNGLTVGGNITVNGGGSADIPWSIKNNKIAGNVTLSGQSTNWIGVLFNQVGKNVTLSNIAINDPDGSGNGAYVGTNVIARNLTCTGVTPKISGGFGPNQATNTVGRNANGQCAALAKP